MIAKHWKHTAVLAIASLALGAAIDAAAADTRLSDRSRITRARSTDRVRLGDRQTRGSTPTPTPVPTPTPTPDRTAPTVPSGVSAVATSCSEIGLHWSASSDTGGSGLGGYDLYRNGNYWTQVLAPFSSIVDGGRPASTGTSYQLAAFDKAGNRSARGSVVAAATPSCPPTTTVGTLRKLGSLSGFAPVYDVAIDGTNELAVVPVVGRGVHVVRLDTPSPSLASVALPGAPVLGVAANGGFAYALVGVVNPTDGRTLVDLVILDLRQPAAPSVVSRIRLGAASGGGIAVDGTTVYASANDMLHVLDVSTPTAPRVVGSVYLGASPSEIAVGGGWLYIQQGFSGGFSSVDVRNPARPVLGFSASWGQAWIAWHEGILYGMSNGAVRIWGGINLASPQLLKDLSVQAFDGAIAGDRIYMALAEQGIGVWDISNPAAPVSVGRVASVETINHIRASSDAGLVVTISGSGVLTAYSVP